MAVNCWMAGSACGELRAKCLGRGRLRFAGRRWPGLRRCRRTTAQDDRGPAAGPKNCPGMAEDEDFFAGEAFAEIVDHFQSVGLHADVHGGAPLNGFGVCGIGFAGAALFPLHYGEVFLPGTLTILANGMKAEPRPP
jgi:hypothetical protein